MEEALCTTWLFHWNSWYVSGNHDYHNGMCGRCWTFGNCWKIWSSNCLVQKTTKNLEMRRLLLRSHLLNHDVALGYQVQTNTDYEPYFARWPNRIHIHNNPHLINARLFQEATRWKKRKNDPTTPMTMWKRCAVEAMGNSTLFGCRVTRQLIPRINWTFLGRILSKQSFEGASVHNQQCLPEWVWGQEKKRHVRLGKSVFSTRRYTIRILTSGILWIRSIVNVAYGYVWHCLRLWARRNGQHYWNFSRVEWRAI